MFALQPRPFPRDLSPFVSSVCADKLFVEPSAFIRLLRRYKDFLSVRLIADSLWGLPHAVSLSGLSALPLAAAWVRRSAPPTVLLCGWLLRSAVLLKRVSSVWMAEFVDHGAASAQLGAHPPGARR
jgi:hypothetical protein